MRIQSLRDDPLDSQDLLLGVDEARFAKVEFALDATQDGVVDAAFITQLDCGLAFDAQSLERQSEVGGVRHEDADGDFDRAVVDLALEVVNEPSGEQANGYASGSQPDEGKQAG